MMVDVFKHGKVTVSKGRDGIFVMYKGETVRFSLYAEHEVQVNLDKGMTYEQAYINVFDRLTGN